jgi:hypothetical protein
MVLQVQVAERREREERVERQDADAPDPIIDPA